MITISDVRAARERLGGVIRDTPLLYSHTFSGFAEGEVFLKAECLQRTGSFKIRGAYNRIRTLPEGTAGVVCASAGNHAQGVALAAQLVGLPAVVAMPVDAPLTKIERTRGYGAEVVLEGRSLEDAYVTARRIAGERGLAFIHPFDDDAVVAGQATLGLELVEQLPGAEVVLVPVGGGGLAAGVALAIKETAPGTRVVGVQARGAAAAHASYHAGELRRVDGPRTLADGIRVGATSERTLELMRRYLDDVVLVSDEEITEAVVQVLDRSKLVVEAAGAAGVAALAAGTVAARGTACAVLSGGNIDLNLMARVVERGLTRAGRYSVIEVRVADRPGSLSAVLGGLALRGANVLDVKHHRAGYEVPVGEVAIELLVETRDAGHARAIVEALASDGVDARVAPPR